MASVDRREFLVGTVGAGVLLRLPAEPAGSSRHALRELRRAVSGRVVVPNGSAALVYNTRFEHRRPDAVVHVRDTADVAAAVRWANRFDVRLVARSGGHSYGGYSTTGDGVVLDLSALRGIRVSGGRATVGPAAKLIDVQRALTAARPHRPVRLLPDGRHRRADARRRARPRGPPFRAHERQPAGGAHRHGRRPRPPRGRRHARGPVLGVPRRRRRELRRRDRAHAEDAQGEPRLLLLRVVAVVAGERGDRRLAALRPRGAARPHLDPVARHDRRLRLAAGGRARAVLRQRGACAAWSGRSRAWPGPRSARGRPATSRWCSAGPAASTAGCRMPPLHTLELLREVGLLRPPRGPARPREDDRLDRAPPAHTLTRVGRAAP